MHKKSSLKHAQFKHPKGLYVLFFAELWERFGFYSVQALLVLFLIKFYSYTDSQAYAFFGAYSALIYSSPVIGGYLADKVLGFQKAIILGAVLYILGYIGLATLKTDFFYLSLSLLIAGNGFFKGNVSTLLGMLYEKNDIRRDSGFTIFYMGINMGIFLSPILCTYAAVNYGWGYGFSLAAVGMLIGLINCLLKFKTLQNHGLSPKTSLNTPYYKILFLLLLSIAIWIGAKLLNYPQFINVGMIVFAVFILAGMAIIALKNTTEKRNKFFALLLLMVVSILFWTFYFQAYLSITLFIERCVDRVIWGKQIPTGMLSSAIGFFNILLAPFFAYVWLRYSNSRWMPSNSTKFALGLIFVSFTFLILVIGSHFSKIHKVQLIWVILSYLLTSCGELCLSPIGLSLVSALAPPNFVGMLMGVWFMTLAAGYGIAGYIAQYTQISTTITDLVTIKQLYTSVFSEFGLIGLGCGLLVLLFTKPLQRLMK
ncbi:MAG: Dipeptide and tripeptide permease A [Legionellaceae bacterium]